MENEANKDYINQIERAHLTLLFHKPHLIQDSCLKEEHFHFSQYRLIYAAFGECYKALKDVTPISIKKYLDISSDEEKVFFAGLVSEVSTESPNTLVNYDHYEKLIIDEWTRSMLKESLSKALAKTRDIKVPIEDIYADLDKDYLNLLQHKSTDVKTQKEVIELVEKELVDQYKIGGKNALTTGFKALDIKSSVVKGRLVIIGANTGNGKTTLAMNIATNVARTLLEKGSKKQVLVFSLEMSAKNLGTRQLCSLAGLREEQLNNNPTSDDMEKIIEAGKEIKKLAIVYKDRSGINISEIRSTIRSEIKKHGIELVVVDYLQLIQPSSNQNFKRNDQIQEITRALKVMAIDLDIPVLALSQLNRSSKDRPDKTPVLSDLRESGSIEQDADKVWLIHEKQGKKGGNYEIIVAKNRQGETFSFEVFFDKSRSQFKEI